MKNEMIWGFMLYLSDHMWWDEDSPALRYMPYTYQDNINTEVKAWDAIMPFLAERQYNLVLIDVGDGIQYESHPEISAPNAWSKDFLRGKLQEMRKLGLEPIPKLNFSAGHDTWMKKYRRMVSTPEYYAFCADVIKEVCEVFDYPRFFHLGCDEERPEYQVENEMIIVRNHDLWWHDFYFLCRECEKYGTRPWIWSDYAWNNQEDFLKHMPTSVLQSNWYYYSFEPRDMQRHHAEISCYEVLERHGYDQIPTGSNWAVRNNLHQTVGFCKETIAPERLKGFLSAPWCSTTDEDFYGLCADAHLLYHGRKAFYPETLK